MSPSTATERTAWRIFGRRIDPTRVTVASTIVVIASLAWLVTFLASGGMGMSDQMTFDMAPLPGFLAVWVVGMVAMMFPVMVPVVLLYDRLRKTPAPGAADPPERSAFNRALSSPLFLSGYLAMYASLGIGAFLVLWIGSSLAMEFPQLLPHAWMVPAAVFIGAGAYQLSPVKQKCLALVHSPLGIFMKGWRDDLPGSFLMGARHGYYCVGCCWLYMIVLTLVGAMGVFWMAAFAVVISVEKATGRWGMKFSKAIAAGFIVVGILFAVQGLPTL